MQYNDHHISTLSFSLDSEALRAGDLAALISLFERLLGSLPQEVSVYCVLDGIAWYENDYYNFTRSTVYLLGRLSELAWPQQQALGQNSNAYGRECLRCSFKLMLASANGTRHIHRALGHLAYTIDVSVGDWDMEKGGY